MEQLAQSELGAQVRYGSMSRQSSASPGAEEQQQAAALLPTMGDHLFSSAYALFDKLAPEQKTKLETVNQMRERGPLIYFLKAVERRIDELKESNKQEQKFTKKLLADRIGVAQQAITGWFTQFKISNHNLIQLATMEEFRTLWYRDFSVVRLLGYMYGVEWVREEVLGEYGKSLVYTEIELLYYYHLQKGASESVSDYFERMPSSLRTYMPEGEASQFEQLILDWTDSYCLMILGLRGHGPRA
jgi:hypothetical protein